MKFFFAFISLLLLTALTRPAAAQSSLAGDTLKSVEIIKADRLQIKKSDNAEVQILGIPDHIIEHGTCRELQKEAGYDVTGITDAVRKMMSTAIRVL